MPTTARAVTIAENGGLDVIHVADREVRDPGPGEVRVAVRAAAVNPSDVGVRTRGADYLRVDPPWVPGWDLAGTIESVGEGVERVSVGEAVMGAVPPARADGGAQASLVVAPAASVVALPEGMGFAEAATLPMNGLTAQRGLELLGLSAGDTLAVAGGAGLLASYVIAFAKADGLRVIADAKPEDEELVRSFGADVVVPRGDFAAAVREVAPDGADAVYDTALLNRDALGAIRDGGRLLVVRGWPDAEPLPRGIEVLAVAVADALERTEWLERIRAFAADGRIRARVAVELPPEDAAEGQRLLEAGGLRGRAVIVFP
jgi:NADPH:quinone reductase-like Zn-dependent oxidoreductase